MAAMRLAAQGIEVLLLDKERFPRDKPCGGGLTPKAFQQLDFDISHLVLHRADRLYLKGPHLAPTLLKARNGAAIWMVRRSDFDACLVQVAQERGAAFHDGETFLRLEMGQAIKVRTTRSEYRARVIIGADGAESLVARQVGLRGQRNRRYRAFALETEVQVRKDVLGGVAFVDYRLPKGYAWIFPKGHIYNIGVGSGDPATLRQLHAHLERFLADMHLPVASRLHPRGHRIPVWTQPEPLHSHNVLLVGDAAGLTDAVWGEGISYALASGQMAAQTITAYLQGQIPDLSAYTEGIAHTLARDLRWLYLAAHLVYGFPSLIFPLLARSPRLQWLVAQIISGDLGHFPSTCFSPHWERLLPRRP